MSATTIKLHKETKNQLDSFREYKNESYDEVIKKLVYIVTQTTDNPELSNEAIRAIKQARKRIQEGNFLTEDEAKKRLGL